MKKILQKTILILTLLVTAQSTFAQYTLKQVIVLNEGPWGGPATVGSYNPSTKTYQNFDTLDARFATDVIIDDAMGYIYVAADTLLVKYDLNTHKKIASQTVKGIRELALWRNQILVTRAETSSLNSFFQVYDKNNLNFEYELTTVSEKTAELKVLNDTAYIAVNGWGTVGKLAVVDLKNKTLKREIDLGPDGLNPEAVMVSKSDGKIYTQNNLDWTDGSVTKYDATTTAKTNTRLNRTTGCSGSARYADNIYFQTSGDTKLSKFGTNTLTVGGDLLINKSLYGIGMDTINTRIYIGATDFFSYGKVYVYDFFSNPVDSFDVNVSPGTFAFDVRSVTANVKEQTGSSNNLLVYPNPANNELNIGFIDSKNQKASVKLFDVFGREVLQKEIKTNTPNTLSIESLATGMYFLQVESVDKKVVKKIVKE